MNVILLTAIVFTVALVHGGRGEFSDGNLAAPRPPKLEPCQQIADIRAYNTFVKRHIVQESFNRTSLNDWQRYLQKSGLCGRTPVQSFSDNKMEILNICSHRGRRLEGVTESDFCISRDKKTIFKVKSKFNKTCTVQSATTNQQHVIVSCDNIKNRGCLPVHFEFYKSQKPGNIACKDP